MEEELHYVTAMFKRKGPAAHEKPSDLEIIYDEVMTCKEQPSDTDPATPEKKKKAARCTMLYLVAAGLGIICVLLVSAVVTVTIYFGAAMSEQRRENIHLEDRNRHMGTEKSALERQNQELTRERDRLHWTVAVILDFENFPVNSRCPQKVCTPCLDGWLLFQSHCYLVTTSTYYSGWKTWAGSREDCSQREAQLVVIESQEEQEFINNHTNYYNDEHHGYWIGLRNMDAWTWVDGSNLTVMFWKAQQASYRPICGLILPQAEPLANWNEASCTMSNRWICETRALIKSD